MTRTSGGDRIGGLSPMTRTAAVCFAAVSFAAMVLTNVPDNGDSNKAAAAFYAVGSHRTQVVVAMYVLVAAMICFLVLLGGLVTRLRATGGGIAADVALAAGSAYVALSLAAAAVFAAPAADVVLNLAGGNAVDPGFARSASTLGDALLLLAAPIAVSVCVAAVCLGARRTGLLPGWLTGSGLVVAAVLLAGVTWVPLPLLLTWVLALGVAGSRPATAVRSASMVGSGSR